MNSDPDDIKDECESRARPVFPPARQACSAITTEAGTHTRALADGNTSRVKSIGEGAAEIRIDRGRGYRVYFGWDGKTLVVLLGGGTKRRQERDVADAPALWRLYKARKATVRGR